MHIEELIARAEIMDVLYRYCRAVDRGDRAGLEAVYHPDGTDEHGTFNGVGSDFATYIVDKMDAAVLLGQHHITNAIFEITGDEAKVESYYLAIQPYVTASGDHQLGFVAGRYLDRFTRIDGRWAISARRVIVDWSRDAISGADWPGQGAFLAPGRRESDPSVGFFDSVA